MAVITALSWAVLAIALKFALNSFSSGTIVWVRMVIATALVAGLFAIYRKSWLKILKRPPALTLLCGALLSVNYYGFMKGVEYTNASNAQILIQLAPLSFALLSIYIYREIPTKIQVLGMLIATLGFAFFYWDQILNSVDQIDRFQTGNLWLLAAAGTWALFALIQKRLIKSFAPQQINLVVYLVSAIILAPSANIAELNNVGWGMGLLLVFLGVNTVIGYGALGEALARIPASHVSIIIAVNPLLTIFIMTLLTRMEVEWIRGEPIHWRGFLGALLVVTGVILTVTKPVRLSIKKRPPTI